MADNHLQQYSGYKINSTKSLALLCTYDISHEKEIRETSTFTISISNIKYLGVTLTKEVKALLCQKSGVQVCSFKICEDCNGILMGIALNL